MRFLYPLWISAALLTLPRPGAAQSAPSKVDIPSLGFVYDNNLSAIRPIWGLPGAAVAGAPLDLGFAVARAAVAAQQRFVLGTSGEDGRVFVITLQDGRPAARPIDGALTFPDRIAVSPSASAAVLYGQDAARLQIVTGLPDAPVIAREMTVDGLGDARGMAVSDDGGLALYVTDRGPVWLFDSNGVRMQVSAPGPIAAVGFRPAANDALAAAGTGELYRIQADGGAAYYGRIDDSGASNPVAVQFSRDGSRAYVAYADGLLAVFDSGAAVSKTISCDCVPTGLDPSGSAMIFRINDAFSGPVMLYDASGADPRIWFVPVDRAQGNAQ